jgi:hypothetical protein
MSESVSREARDKQRKLAWTTLPADTQLNKLLGPPKSWFAWKFPSVSATLHKITKGKHGAPRQTVPWLRLKPKPSLWARIVYGTGFRLWRWMRDPLGR